MSETIQMVFWCGFWGTMFVMVIRNGVVRYMEAKYVQCKCQDSEEDFENSEEEKK